MTRFSLHRAPAGVLLLTAALAGWGCSKPNPTPTAPDAGGDWKPDPALLAELGEPVEVGPYHIRVPKGYTQAARDNPDGSTFVSWQAPPPSPEAGVRIFAVMVHPVPDGEPEKSAAELRTKPKPSSGLVDYVETAPEAGTIDSMLFEKVMTTCAAVKTGRKLRGFQYTRGGRLAVAIVYQGAAEDEQSFRVAETAARTLAARAGGK
jgi:hypothetical protein